jgi:hypothetical protein
MRLVRVGPAWAWLTIVGVVCGLAASHAWADSKQDAAARDKKACDGGEMKGCTNLGVDYDSGEGVPMDVVRAAALYKQACDGRHMKGCYNRASSTSPAVGFPRTWYGPRPSTNRCALAA